MPILSFKSLNFFEATFDLNIATFFTPFIQTFIPNTHTEAHVSRRLKASQTFLLWSVHHIFMTSFY